MKNLSDISPYQGIYDDVCVMGNGDMMFGYLLWYPELWTASQEVYQKLTKELVSLIRKLDNNTTLHWQCYVFDDKFTIDKSKAVNVIQLEDFKSWDQRDMMRSYLYLFVTLSNDSMNKVSAFSNAMMRAAQYVIKRPLKKDKVDELMKRYALVMGSVDKTLEMNPLVDFKRLDSNELQTAIYAYYSQEYGKPVVDTLNKVNPDISFFEGKFRVGQNYVGVVTLVREGEVLFDADLSVIPRTSYNEVDMPEEVGLPSSMSFQLTYGLPFAHIYNVAIEKMENEKAFAAIKDESPGLRMLAMANVGRAIRKRNEIGGLKSRDGEILSNGIIDQVEKDNHQVVRTRVNVVVKDPDYNVLQSKLESVRNALLSINESVGTIENDEAVNLFFASAPGNMRENYKYFWELAQQGVMYVPKESLYRSDKEGLYFKDRTGKPVVVNMWKNKHIVARNAVVFAPTGSGKSVLLNHIVNQYAGAGNTVIIIDIGGSFKNNTIINKGFYFDAADSKNLSFNIFLCPKDVEGNYVFQPTDEEEADGNDEVEVSRKNDVVNFVYSILVRIWKGDQPVPKETKAAMKKTIVAFYQWVNKHKKIPTLKIYDTFIEKYIDKILTPSQLKYFDMEGFRLVLEDFVTGQYKELLNNTGEGILSDEQLMVFDLEAIKDNHDINQIVIAIIMHTASEIIYYRKGRKAYIVDEAIDYMKGDMGEFIAGQYRKIRKKNGQVIISTQGIGYLEDLEELTKKSIFGNSAITFLLDHGNDQGSKPLLQKNLSMTSHQMDMLDSVGRGEGYREVLVKMGRGYCQVLRVQVSDFALAAYSTDPEDVAQIKKYYEQTGDVVTALYEYVESKN